MRPCYFSPDDSNFARLFSTFGNCVFLCSIYIGNSFSKVKICVIFLIYTFYSNQSSIFVLISQTSFVAKEYTFWVQPISENIKISFHGSFLGNIKYWKQFVLPFQLSTLEKPSKRRDWGWGGCISTVNIWISFIKNKPPSKCKVAKTAFHWFNNWQNWKVLVMIMIVMGKFMVMSMVVVMMMVVIMMRFPGKTQITFSQGMLLSCVDCFAIHDVLINQVDQHLNCSWILGRLALLSFQKTSSGITDRSGHVHFCTSFSKIICWLVEWTGMECKAIIMKCSLVYPRLIWY